jgi:translation initiation factor 4E
MLSLSKRTWSGANEKIESFLHLYSHLTPVSELVAVTDILVFLSRIGRPGIWEEMRE